MDLKDAQWIILEPLIPKPHVRSDGRGRPWRHAREVLGETVSDPTVARIVELASGNAFYLEELIRAVAEGREEALPETVLAMVEARL